MFDFTNDAENFVSFTGCGPIPGIVSARYVTGGAPASGSRRTILKTDGTEHHEEIVLFDRPRRHTSRVTGFGPPFSWLVRFADDDWVFIAANDVTLVERTFVLTLTSPIAAPVAFVLLHTFMRVALRRDLENIATKSSLDTARPPS